MYGEQVLVIVDGLGWSVGPCWDAKMWQGMRGKVGWGMVKVRRRFW